MSPKRRVPSSSSSPPALLSLALAAAAAAFAPSSPLAPLVVHASATDEPPSCEPCDETDCPDSDSVFAGLHREISSPTCPEGSVATVTKLRTSSSSGEYEILTWNDGGSTVIDDFVWSPYKYGGGTAGEDVEVTCFEADSDDLPIVGDQTNVLVTLNCESARCDFRWYAQFGCAETGVLESQAGAGGGVQVLADVDDTVVCPNPSHECDSFASCAARGADYLKHYLAGADRRLESGEFYPGVAELMLGLALGSGDGRNAAEGGEPYVPARPMMLSARPREAELFLGIDQGSDLNRYLERVGDRTSRPTWGANVDGSLYGTVADGTSFKEFGQTKARSFDRVSDERPATRFAFLGDNGQGDVCAAQSMLESDHGDRMAAVFIQMTQDPANAIDVCESPDGEDFDLILPEGDRVHYFGTYSDAALWALDKGLISCCSAAAVYYAVEEWHGCRCGTGGGGGGGGEGEEEEEGGCPPGTLPTGVDDAATRTETLEYCVDVAVDQGRLEERIESCAGGCSTSRPRDVLPVEEYASAAGLGVAFAGLLPVIMLMAAGMGTL